jgi:hypothetical protein
MSLIEEQIKYHLSVKSDYSYDSLAKLLNMSYSRLEDYKIWLEILPKRASSYKEVKTEVEDLVKGIQRLRRVLGHVC